MQKIDFIVPVCKNNIILRTVIEALYEFYEPRTIYLITKQSSLTEIQMDAMAWKIPYNHLAFVNEELYFIKHFQLHRDDIEKMYTYKDHLSREFGWWYQQLIKLGAYSQLEVLSDPFVIWDADLIPLIKWDLYPTCESPFYYFAILQEFPKNKWNMDQYAQSIFELLHIEAIDPKEGTFVPHHFIIHYKVIQHMLQDIERFHPGKTWIETIIQLSNTYYRFSEYKCLATYMHSFYPEFLSYHSFSKYGKTGIRYRDHIDILPLLLQKLSIQHGISYFDFIQFIKTQYIEIPSYIQIEHL